MLNFALFAESNSTRQKVFFFYERYQPLTPVQGASMHTEHSTYIGSEKKNNNSETPPQEKKLQAVLGLATFTEKLVLLMLYKAKAHITCICNITW